MVDFVTLIKMWIYRGVSEGVRIGEIEALNI